MLLVELVVRLQVLVGEPRARFADRLELFVLAKNSFKKGLKGLKSMSNSSLLIVDR